MFSKKILPALMFGVFAASGASAAPLLLQAYDGAVPQSGSNPCVIAGTTCPSNPISATIFGNDNFSGTSPVYTYTPGTTSGTNFGFTLFDIAVDSATKNQPSTDTLASFSVDVRANSSSPFVSIYTYSGFAGNIGDPQNNGNGRADYLLQTVDLSSLTIGSQLRFSAVVTDSTGGPESFYIIARQPAPVPVPASLALLGLGLAAFGFVRRK
jgi:PEP-CTERM motif